MSGTTPPPPPYDGGPPAGGPPSAPMWVSDQGPGAARPPSHDGPPTSRRGFKVLVLSLALTMLVGGGAFAFYQADPFHLFRSGPQASDALPGNAIFYAGMDLDPKASQKIDALRFLNHFPAFRDNAGLPDANADILDSVVGKAIDQLHCAGVTYAADVKPWLGERFGLAVMPGTAAAAAPVAFAVQVSDDDAARKGIDALNGCDQSVAAGVTGGSTLGVAFDNGFMLLAETQAQADAYARSADAHSLSDDAEFSADVSSLGDLGVATVWADVPGLANTLGGVLGVTDPQTPGLGSLGSSKARVAATFRFGSDNVEVATSVFGDVSHVDHGDNPVVGLPDSTVFALSLSGLGPQVADEWKKGITQLQSQDPSIPSQLSQFEAQTGLALPADLQTLLGDNLLLALDQQGLTADALDSGDLSRLNAGARFTTDPAKLDALYTKVTDLIGSASGSQVSLSKKDFADGVALATNPAYAARLADLGGSLGDSDAFRSVIDDGAGKDFVLFFSFDAVKDQILTSMSNSGVSQSTMDNLRPLEAFGLTADVDGHYSHVTLRLSVDD